MSFRLTRFRGRFSIPTFVEPRCFALTRCRSIDLRSRATRIAHCACRGSLSGANHDARSMRQLVNRHGLTPQHHLLAAPTPLSQNPENGINVACCAPGAFSARTTINPIAGVWANSTGSTPMLNIVVALAATTAYSLCPITALLNALK